MENRKREKTGKWIPPLSSTFPRLVQGIVLYYSPSRSLCGCPLCQPPGFISAHHETEHTQFTSKCGESPVLSVRLIRPFLIWSLLSSPAINHLHIVLWPLMKLFQCLEGHLHSLLRGPLHRTFPRVLFSSLPFPSLSFSSQIWCHFLSETLLSPLDYGWRGP